jgi:RNA polymerase-binding transcription factor DksA
MATKKKAAKPAPKNVVKPAKKTAPAKKPVAKVVAKKPVAKPSKIIAKKPTPVKVAAKKPVKVVAKVKPSPKVVAKKVVAKPVAKAAPAKVVAVAKPIQKPMPKKIIETKKPVAKTAPVAEKIVAKPPTPVAVVKPKDIKVAPPKPVVLPKINTKTSRTYQPDFTKSVLDQPKHDLGAPLIRYNDTDLAEFRELIQRKLESAKKELGYLQGLITRKDEMGGDNDDARYMTMEDGSMSMEREQLSQMASRQITFIDHLEKALMRIENQTYGICRITGKLIDKARLRAVPHATLSIEAKMSGGK